MFPGRVWTKGPQAKPKEDADKHLYLGNPIIWSSDIARYWLLWGDL